MIDNDFVKNGLDESVIELNFNLLTMLFPKMKDIYKEKYEGKHEDSKREFLFDVVKTFENSFADNK